jgi:aminoglycoside/choline kinase family phosphotransferase
MAFRQRFDYRLYMWEFEHFMEYGFQAAASAPTRKAEREPLMRAFGQIARRLDSQTPYLNHRDFHSWNLMVHQDEVAVIDFQDALLAPLQYDLASLLNDRHTDQIIGPKLEARLIDYYVERFEALSRTRLRRDEFFEIYVLSALQRDFKVAGRFRYLQTVKGKPDYARYIPATLRRLKRNLERLPATASLVPILASHFEEMR